MACIEKRAQLNDNGVSFVLTVKDCVAGTETIVNLSGTTSKEIIFKSPSGTTATKTASFESDGTDGKIKYTTVSGDLNEVGTWRIQAEVQFTAHNVYRSEIETFKVYENL
tara:strand:- start:1499 stop:1828 length:330 start_codon:yes stop_codon:yes gene_type:complete